MSQNKPIITGLRLARDPRAGSKTERVIDAVEDGIFLANQIYEKALLHFGQGTLIPSGEHVAVSVGRYRVWFMDI
jgi:hypothetical protein